MKYYLLLFLRFAWWLLRIALSLAIGLGVLIVCTYLRHIDSSENINRFEFPIFRDYILPAMLAVIAVAFGIVGTFLIYLMFSKLKGKLLYE